MSIRLSKSALEKFRSCPRCFYLDKVKGIKQPEGIRSGLPMGMDRILKAHYDMHRAKGSVPPELDGLVDWKLYGESRISMKDLRNWRKGLAVIIDGVKLSTALDDMLERDGIPKVFAMIDYKTKAKSTDEIDTQKYYGTQADCYDLALNANDYPTTGMAYFAYYYPELVSGGEPRGDGHNVVFMGWRCQVIRIKADHERAKVLVLAAAKCLESAEPDPSKDCDYCHWEGALQPKSAPATTS